jgi:outer membrane protein assembly factor BamD
LKQNRILFCAALAATCLAGCSGKKQAKGPTPGTSAEPDKVLYDKSANDMKHGRYGVGRLGMQTLINTYPDSEYLAKAKLAIGDSYYKEGGTAGLKQAIVEYKDFETFFPFLDEAAYAQMQIAMAHYRQMEKPDRDHVEAVQAEAEFQTFLEKYPSSPLATQAEQRLREVQEVLAEGNFRVANFYYLRGAYRAAGARLIELTNRYPLYSQADQANWMLGQIYEKGEHNEIAARYYSRIVKDYPLSGLAGDAKAKLTKFGVPVPPADPTAVARMQKEEAADRANRIKRAMTILKTSPDVSMAAQTGPPTMTPASESGDETLVLGLQPNVPAVSTSGVGSTAAVETITPGSPEALPPPPATTPAAASSDSAAPAADSTAAPTASDAAQPASSTASDSPAAGTSTDGTTAQPAADSSAASQPANSNQESSSKKKKGLRKIIPF